MKKHIAAMFDRYVDWTIKHENESAITMFRNRKK